MYEHSTPTNVRLGKGGKCTSSAGKQSVMAKEIKIVVNVEGAIPMPTS